MSEMGLKSFMKSGFGTFGIRVMKAELDPGGSLPMAKKS